MGNPANAGSFRPTAPVPKYLKLNGPRKIGSTGNLIEVKLDICKAFKSVSPYALVFKVIAFDVDSIFLSLYCVDKFTKYGLKGCKMI